MDNSDQNDGTGVLVSLSGCLTVALGIILIFLPPVYIVSITSPVIITYEKDFSIFTIIAGLFLIRNGFNMKEHRKRSWTFNITRVIL